MELRFWSQYHWFANTTFVFEPPFQTFETKFIWLYQQYEYCILKIHIFKDIYYLLPPRLLHHLISSFNITHLYFSSSVTCLTCLTTFHSVFLRKKIFGSIHTTRMELALSIHLHLHFFNKICIGLNLLLKMTFKPLLFLHIQTIIGIITMNLAVLNSLIYMSLLISYPITYILWIQYFFRKQQTTNKTTHFKFCINITTLYQLTHYNNNNSFLKLQKI